MDAAGDDALSTRIAGWLADEGIDPSYVAFVVRHANEPDAAWRWCCGSTCDPCVQGLGRVVDRARLASQAHGVANGRAERRPGLPGSPPQ